MFYNYKYLFAVILMGVADAKCRFVCVDIGGYGRDCATAVFKRSTLWISIQTTMLELPSERLSGTEGPNVPHFFVGDEGFTLNRYTLRPFGGSNLSVKKRVYSYRLCRPRRYVECALGILSNEWRIFQRPLSVGPDFAAIIVKASAVLHNFVLERDGCKFEDALTVTGLEDVTEGQSVRGGLTASNVRNKVTDCCLTCWSCFVTIPGIVVDRSGRYPAAGQTTGLCEYAYAFLCDHYFVQL
jgi:hypothetical protein